MMDREAFFGQLQDLINQAPVPETVEDQKILGLIVGSVAFLRSVCAQLDKIQLAAEAGLAKTNAVEEILAAQPMGD